MTPGLETQRGEVYVTWTPMMKLLTFLLTGGPVSFIIWTIVYFWRSARDPGNTCLEDDIASVTSLDIRDMQDTQAAWSTPLKTGTKGRGVHRQLSVANTTGISYRLLFAEEGMVDCGFPDEALGSVGSCRPSLFRDGGPTENEVPVLRLAAKRISNFFRSISGHRLGNLDSRPAVDASNEASGLLGTQHSRVVSLRSNTSPVGASFEMNHKSSRDRPGRTALHIASALGSLAAVRSLLDNIENRSDIQARDFTGRTPLHAAAQEGHAHIVKELLSHGMLQGSAPRSPKGDFDLNAPDAQGDTALHVAAAKGYSHVIRVMQRLAGPSLKDCCRNTAGYTPLHLAAMEGHHDAVVQLLESTSNSLADSLLSPDDTEGMYPATPTPLHLASVRGHVKVVKTLLSWMRYHEQGSVSGDEAGETMDVFSSVPRAALKGLKSFRSFRYSLKKTASNTRLKHAASNFPGYSDRFSSGSTPDASPPSSPSKRPAWSMRSIGLAALGSTVRQSTDLVDRCNEAAAPIDHSEERRDSTVQSPARRVLSFDCPSSRKVPVLLQFQESHDCSESEDAGGRPGGTDAKAPAGSSTLDTNALDGLESEPGHAPSTSKGFRASALGFDGVGHNGFATGTERAASTDSQETPQQASASGEVIGARKAAEIRCSPPDSTRPGIPSQNQDVKAGSKLGGASPEEGPQGKLSSGREGTRGALGLQNAKGPGSKPTRFAGQTKEPNAARRRASQAGGVPRVAGQTAKPEAGRSEVRASKPSHTPANAGAGRGAAGRGNPPAREALGGNGAPKSAARNSRGPRKPAAPGIATRPRTGAAQQAHPSPSPSLPGREGPPEEPTRRPQDNPASPVE